MMGQGVCAKCGSDDTTYYDELNTDGLVCCIYKCDSCGARGVERWILTFFDNKLED